MAFAVTICLLLLLKVGLVFEQEYPAIPIYTNTFIIKVRNAEDIPDILRLHPELKLKKKMIPRLYEFYKDPEDGVTNNSTYISNLKKLLQDKVVYVEQAKSYIKPIDENGQLKKAFKSNGRTHTYDERKQYSKVFIDKNLARHRNGITQETLTGLHLSLIPRALLYESLQAPYYGMGIPEAWEKGNTGKGVVIGITDVGVNTDIPDFRGKIDFVLSKSFVIDNWGLEPTDFMFYPEDVFRDHGNNCAGLIIGILNNSECTVGVAHDAKLAVLKIFSFAMGRMVINEAKIAEALVHELERIHIFSNSWSTEIDHHFHLLPGFVPDMIEHGILKGRHGKGRIHVFPPGGLAGGFANSPYTITVNAVGIGGRNTEFSTECACVLTTAYGEGHTNSSNEFITTSSNQGNCTDIFKGTSPATAIMAGVIALVLQENDHLTWREVQYLIIQSSSMAGIQNTTGFVKNAVGRFYHGSYGYGLINATTMLSEAKRFQKLPEQIVYTSQDKDFISQRLTADEAIWKLHIACPCDSKRKACMTSVEQVIVKTSFTTHLENETELIIISPSQTKSYLMQSGQSYGAATKRENGELLSVHFWGEKAVGDWSLKLRKTTQTKEDAILVQDIAEFQAQIMKGITKENSTGTVSIQSFVITLFGTTAEIPGVQNTNTLGDISENMNIQCYPNHSSVNKQGVVILFTFIICVLCVLVWQWKRRHSGLRQDCPHYCCRVILVVFCLVFILALETAF